MRVPSAEAPRRRLGLRAWIIGLVVLLLVVLASLQGLALFYTDFLWFDAVGFDDVWQGLLAARVVPALVFTAVFFAVMLANLIIADRLAPDRRGLSGPEDEMIERYRSFVAPYAGRIRVGISLFFALIAGAGVSSQWESWILFNNRVEFGVEDAQFGYDVGFYVFQLPFIRFAIGWAFISLLVVLLVTAVFHYVNGGIRLQSPFQRVTPQVKAHLSVILAVMALVKTAQYWFDRFELTFSGRGAVDGASYTDVNAQLPALNLLMIISVGAAGLFIANIWRRGWVLPIIAVGLWGFISVVVGTIVPEVIQRFQVQPNEFAREQEFIDRNIDATRAAFALDGIREEPFDYDVDLDAADIDRPGNATTLANARLWDPDVIIENFQATQEFRTFYDFDDVDVDRYEIDGERIPVMAAARELDRGGLPSNTWTNRHLVYTHGFGGVIAEGNEQRDGEPDFLLRDVSLVGEVDVDQPGLYYGENLGGYSVVDSELPEIEPRDEEAEADEGVRYEGEGGVSASGFVRRAALALRFRDYDLFVSGQLTGDSRVLYVRDVRDRVEKAAPFLRFDADPYPVFVDGRITWVVDGYTTTSKYPYSQSLRPEGLSGASGLDTDFNYVRNSVKATVDAYDGTLTFYVVDDEDPIIEAYRSAFPDLFTDGDEIPDELREHFRYPQDMFRAQTEQYSQYHMTDAQTFYNKTDLWAVAPEPTGGAQGPVDTAAPTTAAGGNDGGRSATLRTTGRRIDPLYMLMQLPDAEQQEFLLMRPYVPINRDALLQAFIAVKSDPDNYGEIVVYEMPANTEVPSPAQAGTQIDSDEFISPALSLLDQRGSTVIRGRIQLIPIENSILYVRPIYVEGSGDAQFARYRFVAVAYGGRSVLDVSVEGALDQLFRGAQPPPEVTRIASGEPGEDVPDEPDEPDEPATTTTTAPEPGTTTTTAPSVDDPDLEARLQAIEELLEEIRGLLEEQAGTTTTTTSSPEA